MVLGLQFRVLLLAFLLFVSDLFPQAGAKAQAPKLCAPEAIMIPR